MILTRISGGAVAAICLLLLAGGVSTPKPDPVGRGQLGAAYGQLGRPSGTRLIATCGDDLLATEARAALSSWASVMRHTDVCDLPTIRYYTTPESMGAATGALSLLTGRPGACGAEARQAIGRFTALGTRLRSFADDGAAVCGVGLVAEDTQRSVNAALTQQTRVEQMIRTSFPELGG